MPETFDENRYMSVSFRVKEGYSFKPKTTNVYTMPVNTGTKANIRIMLIDERSSTPSNPRRRPRLRNSASTARWNCASTPMA